jgi:hypothetical protein
VSALLHYGEANVLVFNLNSRSVFELDVAHSPHPFRL